MRKVKVPEGLYPFEDYNFIVRTPAFSSKYGQNEKSCPGDFTYIPAPRITNISPVEGFSNQDDNPYFADFEETLITIAGSELLLDDSVEYVVVRYGNGNDDFSIASILERSNTELVVQVPPGLSPGEKELYLENPWPSQYPDTWEKTQSVPFTVIDKPVLNEISTQNPQSGELVSIEGKNLQQAICLLDDRIIVTERMSETGIRFTMPGGEDYEQLTLTVWHPTGKAEKEYTITRSPGEVPPEYGLTITFYEEPIPEFQLSLEQALRISRGGSIFDSEGGLRPGIGGSIDPEDLTSYNTETGRERLVAVYDSSDEASKNFRISNLHLGPGDRLDMHGVNLSCDSITFEEGCRYYLGNASISSPIIIRKNSITLGGVFQNLIQPDTEPAFLRQPAGKVLAREVSAIQPMQLADTGSLSIQSGKSKPGETIMLSVDLANAQELGNLAFDIQFDDSVMKLMEMPLGAASQDGLNASNPLDYPSDTDLVRFNWICAEGYTGDGNAMQLKFQVNSLAREGENPIELQNISA